jgi:hypothetical protein
MTGIKGHGVLKRPGGKSESRRLKGFSHSESFDRQELSQRIHRMAQIEHIISLVPSKGAGSLKWPEGATGPKGRQAERWREDEPATEGRGSSTALRPERR